jgi:hypothetical protein
MGAGEEVNGCRAAEYEYVRQKDLDVGGAGPKLGAKFGLSLRVGWDHNLAGHPFFP